MSTLEGSKTVILPYKLKTRTTQMLKKQVIYPNWIGIKQDQRNLNI